MNDWKKVKLGDISDMCLGKMLDKEKNKGNLQPYLANINVRWGSFDLTNLNMMRFEDDEDERYGLKYGDLVICEGGEPGRCAIWKEKIPNMKIQKALHRVRINGDYSNEFVYYRFLLAGRNRELDKHFIGSTIKHLTGIGLRDIEFAYPSLKEQQKIATLLSVLDTKIELNQRINAELEQVAKTLYDYWFIQFEFPTPPPPPAIAGTSPKSDMETLDNNKNILSDLGEAGRGYKSAGGKMVWNEELKRDIPLGWEVDLLGNHIKINRGISYKGTDLQVSGIPMVNLNSIYLDGSYKKEGIKYLADTYKNSKEIHAGDLLFAATDVTRNAYIIGKSLILPDLFTCKVVASSDIGQVDVGEKLDKHFLNMLFNSDSYHRYIKGFASGTLVLHLNTKGIEWYKTVIPPKDLLNKYGKIKNNIEHKKALILKESETLTELRDWLLPMLMNGQVVVNGL